MPRWSRPSASQTNWFAIATAIAAITVAFCGGGLTVGGPVGGQAESLTLTLRAPEICEASHPKGYRAHNLEWDEEEEVWRDVFFKWWSWPSVGTMEVSWAVNGGDAPYMVMIASEAYNGASGTAEVSCALEHGPVFDHPLRADFERIHPFDDKPVVDSGIKTVMATVTDSSGATSEATTEVYVILSAFGDHVLRAGETYRVQGWLVTVPGAVDMRIGSYETATCEPIGDDGRRNDDVACEDSFDLNIETEDYEAWVALGVQTGTERGRRVRLVDEHAPDATTLSARVHAALDELAASVGQAPKLPSGAEPLTLTLSAPEICETTHPKGGWTHGLDWNEEEQAWEDIVDEAWWWWDSVGTMEVGWSASGGDGAYTVTIATETYTGASGTAEVSCAMQHGPITDHPEWGGFMSSKIHSGTSGTATTRSRLSTPASRRSRRQSWTVWAQPPRRRLMFTRS